MNYFRTRKRRGLSSIIGTLFFIAIMLAAFTAMIAAFSYQNDLIDTQRTIADLEIAKSQESFIVKGELEVASVTCSPTLPYNGCLKVTVYNKGTNPVEVDQLWLIQKAAPYDATPYNQGSSPPLMFQDLVVPISTSKDITSNSIEIDVNRLYSIKVVSKLGTIVTADVPDTCPGCQQGEEGLQCWDLNNNGVGDDPISPPIVINGVTYNTEDTDGDGFFTAIDCRGQPGASETIALDQGLLNKPEIFMIFPSPFGADNNNPGNHKGAWGVTVANPAEIPMVVNKIVITGLPTQTQSGETVFPQSGSYQSWFFKGNQIYWYGSPVTIPARSAQTFLVSVSPSSTIPSDQSGLPVFANVQTSFGQFGKTSYLSSVIKPTSTNRAPIVNVYRSDDPGSINSIQGTWVLNGGGTYTTYITLAENSTATTSSYIKSTNGVTHLIINVPKKFTVVSATSNDFTIPPIVPNSDGSTQIIGTLINPIGDSSGVAARSITLTVTAPNLAAENPPITNPKLFVMYILADGEASYESTKTWEIGPIDEVVIKVTP